MLPGVNYEIERSCTAWMPPNALVRPWISSSGAVGSSDLGVRAAELTLRCRRATGPRSAPRGVSAVTARCAGTRPSSPVEHHQHQDDAEDQLDRLHELDLLEEVDAGDPTERVDPLT